MFKQTGPLLNGVVRIDAAASEALSAGAGTLVLLDFQVIDTGTGTALLDLQSAALNDGALVLTPAPRVGFDATDAILNLVTSVPVTAQPLLTAYPVSASPAATIVAPVDNAAPSLHVDWSARFADFSLTTGTGNETTKPSWLKRFVSDLALKPDAVNPNANIRVSLPATVENGPRLRNPVGLL